MAKGDEPPPAKKARAGSHAGDDAGPPAPNGGPVASQLAPEGTAAAAGGRGRRKGPEKPSTTQFGELITSVGGLGGLGGGEEGGEGEDEEVRGTPACCCGLAHISASLPGCGC
jgi:hypothetical protein